jgi:anti-anti-sigma factor
LFSVLAPLSESTVPMSFAIPLPPPPDPAFEATRPAVEVRIRFDPRLPLVRVVGELDLVSTHLLADAMGAVATTPCLSKMVLLDLDGVSFCDVAGLRALETSALTLERAGVRLVLYQPPCVVRKLIASSGVASRLECR